MKTLHLGLGILPFILKTILFSEGTSFKTTDSDADVPIKNTKTSKEIGIGESRFLLTTNAEITSKELNGHLFHQEQKNRTNLSATNPLFKLRSQSKFVDVGSDSQVRDTDQIIVQSPGAIDTNTNAVAIKISSNNLDPSNSNDSKMSMKIHNGDQDKDRNKIVISQPEAIDTNTHATTNTYSSNNPDPDPDRNPVRDPDPDSQDLKLGRKNRHRHWSSHPSEHKLKHSKHKKRGKKGKSSRVPSSSNCVFDIPEKGEGNQERSILGSNSNAIIDHPEVPETEACKMERKRTRHARLKDKQNKDLSDENTANIRELHTNSSGAVNVKSEKHTETDGNARKEDENKFKTSANLNDDTLNKGIQLSIGDRMKNQKSFSAANSKLKDVINIPHFEEVANGISVRDKVKIDHTQDRALTAVDNTRHKKKGSKRKSSKSASTSTNFDSTRLTNDRSIGDIKNKKDSESVKKNTLGKGSPNSDTFTYPKRTPSYTERLIALLGVSSNKGDRSMANYRGHFQKQIPVDVVPLENRVNTDKSAATSFIQEGLQPTNFLKYPTQSNGRKMLYSKQDRSLSDSGTEPKTYKERLILRSKRGLLHHFQELYGNNL